jgi:hypothetical protein
MISKRQTYYEQVCLCVGCYILIFRNSYYYDVLNFKFVYVLIELISGLEVLS